MKPGLMFSMENKKIARMVSNLVFYFVYSMRILLKVAIFPLTVSMFCF